MRLGYPHPFFFRNFYVSDDICLVYFNIRRETARKERYQDCSKEDKADMRPGG